MTVARALALAIFLMTYLGLALGRVPGFRIDRTGMAIVGAAAAVATGAIAWDRAVAAVDAHTLILLFGMMVVGAYLRLSGFFALVTRQTVRLARTPVALLGLLVLAAGVLSALFVNDVVRLVLAPLVVDLAPARPAARAVSHRARGRLQCRQRGDPYPQPAEHAGGELLGGELSRVPPRRGPRRPRRPRRGVPRGVAHVPPAAAPRARAGGPDERLALHYPLMWKTGAVALVMLAGFLAGVPIALVAIAGAAYTLITRRVKPEKVYAEINWGLLVLFAGLFVVIGAVEDSGSPRISSPWRAGPTSTSRPSSSP